MEFTNPKMHAGWRGGVPVFVVFSLDSAKALFSEFESGVIAICVAPPHAGVVETLEQAVHFFSGDDAAAFTGGAIFAI